MKLEYLALGFMLALLAMEVFKGSYSRQKVSLNDWVINVTIFLQENFVRPLFALGIALACAWSLPAYQNLLSDLPFWPTLVAFFFFLFSRFNSLLVPPLGTRVGTAVEHSPRTPFS